MRKQTSHYDIQHDNEHATEAALKMKRIRASHPVYNQCDGTHKKWENLPSVIIGLIESYLHASSIVPLSCTSRQMFHRWTALRWKRTFQLHHHGNRMINSLHDNDNADGSCTGTAHLKKDQMDRWETYHVAHFGGWEKSFVGCCCGQCGSMNDETQFYASALIPSLRKAYGELWGGIELSILGYHDATLDQDDWSTRIHPGSAGVLWSLVHILYLLVTPFRELINSSFPTRGEKQIFLTNHTSRLLRNGGNNICSWKLAMLLEESGVDCFQCHLCGKLDVGGNGDSWIAPCRCQALVHRKCLEEKLGLKQKLYIFEVLKELILRGDKLSKSNQMFETNEIAPQIWVSYDLRSIPTNETDAQSGALNHPISVDGLNRFISPNARCHKCGEIYERSVRLPRSISEVLFASLSDPLALFRAISTFAHFLLCIFCIAFIEGRCNDLTCGDQIILSDRWIPLHWPGRTWKGLALAWWQLQQSCMLHILCSRRFSAVVDLLWRNAISTFYIRLYIYFVATSIVLALSFLPAASRMFRRNIVSQILSDDSIASLSPIWDIIAIGNLVHYFISSMTVIAIFWRTNYRIYTIANKTRKIEDDTLNRRMHQTQLNHHRQERTNDAHHPQLHERRIQDMNVHPIYSFN